MGDGNDPKSTPNPTHASRQVALRRLGRDAGRGAGGGGLPQLGRAAGAGVGRRVPVHGRSSLLRAGQ
eukprot:2594653-Pyramimonas_sp.AAC.1